MKVLAWNLNHRIRQKRNLDGLATVFDALDADLVLLNEFVDGPTRSSFWNELDDAGYVYRLVSWTPDKHNQICAASKSPLTPGDIAPPQFDGPAVSNFLHVRVEGSRVEFVGLRVPAYVKLAERKAYRAELLEILRQAADRPIVFAGDLNEDPFTRQQTPDRPRIAYVDCDSYSIQNPVGASSYIGSRGTSRIDHALASNAVRITDSTYVADYAGRVLAGRSGTPAISDHAALTFTANLAGP